MVMQPAQPLVGAPQIDAAQQLMALLQPQHQPGGAVHSNPSDGRWRVDESDAAQHLMALLQPQRQPGGAVHSNPVRNGGTLAPPTPLLAKPADDGSRVVGGEYEGKAADGVWWHVTIVAMNPDDTLEVEVQDGYGSRWSRVPRCNVRGRGGGAPLIQPLQGTVPQPPPQAVSQPPQPQSQLTQQPLQQPLMPPPPGFPLPPMPVQQPLPMLCSPHGQIGMQPLDRSQSATGGLPGVMPQPAVGPMHESPGGLMPQLDDLDRSSMYLQQVWPPPLMSPHSPQMLQSPLAQQFPVLPQTPVVQPTMQLGMQPDPNSMLAHDVHAQAHIAALHQQQYENAMNLRNNTWAAQRDSWQHLDDQLLITPSTAFGIGKPASPTRQQHTPTQQLSIDPLLPPGCAPSVDPLLPPGYAPSVVWPTEEDQPPTPDFNPRGPLGASVGGRRPGTAPKEDNSAIGIVPSKQTKEAEDQSTSDSEGSSGAHRRSSSDSQDVTPIKSEKEEAWSNSTPSVVNDDGSSNSPTPRTLSWDASKSPTTRVPAEVRETLAKLTHIVLEDHYKREDLENHEATVFLYPYIPLDEEGNATSLGSILHLEGSCKPCAFLNKQRCHKKDLCIYCHYVHDDVVAAPSTSKRKSKRKRKALQRRAVGHEQLHHDDNDDENRYYL